MEGQGTPDQLQAGPGEPPRDRPDLTINLEPEKIVFFGWYRYFQIRVQRHTVGSAQADYTVKGGLQVHNVLKRMSIPHLYRVKEHKKLYRSH